ncbi:LOW QUALITY PROTEIN: hypothetical protein V2J09_013994 [Rumex salicifolius]
MASVVLGNAVSITGIGELCDGFLLYVQFRAAFSVELSAFQEWLEAFISLLRVMTEMDRDPFDSLDHDVAVKIFMCLDDPGDIVRASCVSHPWRDFVISNGICKQLCLIMFPQLSRIAHTVDLGNKKEEPREVGCSSSNEWENALREHRIYASLARNLSTFKPGDCVSAAICASSTDNYPEETIANTLDPRDRIGRRASYWSSSGQKDPSVPERLTYKLVSNFCVISEINVQPFRAYFQRNFPIYSAKSVRFRMGHQVLPDECEDDKIDPSGKVSFDHRFVWTYTSPEFPMTQVDNSLMLELLLKFSSLPSLYLLAIFSVLESTLQNFKLPEMVLCIGGVLQIELLGFRDKKWTAYFIMTHVQALGRSLSPVFGAEVTEQSGRFTLNYNPDAQFPPLSAEESDSDVASLSNVQPERMQRHIRGWEHILNILRGNMGGEVFYSDDEHQDSDEEFFEDFAD